ncbi:glycoside hydrolase family 76 protein [Athelia psychrophila]|uniref:Glycoside hydrolase family 76 protein n=1 Tax=Athelia psychrophila TaxID=1759441 RepID=A0A166GYY1_9AGAM|nr:glycoside hydrolase family 76 protein [Fibularhizoctonia sp. CBS 109695]
MSISSARLYGITILALGTLSAAQDLGVPLGWREFSNKYSQATLVSNAVAGINAIMPQLTSSNAQFTGIGYWQAANVWSNLANNDHWAGTTTYQSQVVANLNTAWSLYANYDEWGYNDDAQWWGSAAYYAYRAYDDSGMLANAVATWNHVSSYVITAADASAGSISTKNFAIKGTCNGATMAGGVFWRPTDDDTNVNAITTGLYLSLSAFLADATGDSTYTNAAILSANWIKGQVLNSNYLVLDTVQANDCTTSPATELFTYNSGKAVEGLAVLAKVTGDSQWSDLYTNIVAASVKNTVWQGANGVITEGASATANNDVVGFKSVLLRGLHEVYARSTNSDLKTLIHSYLDVQYNAIMELAETGSTYSSSWTGPAQSFTTWGQLAALDVLTTALDTNK